MDGWMMTSLFEHSRLSKIVGRSVRQVGRADSAYKPKFHYADLNRKTYPRGSFGENRGRGPRKSRTQTTKRVCHGKVGRLSMHASRHVKMNGCDKIRVKKPRQSLRTVGLRRKVGVMEFGL